MIVENVKNYSLVEKRTVKDINSEVYYLTHNKTKAKVLLIENDDNDKTFGIGFRTPPVDNCGTPHIIEHSVLCGSRKFKAKEPFVELMKASLNTFLNAMTYPDKTIYPVSSCNDKDFKNLMDVYLDAVFFPNIYTNKKIFMQEGWHYELDDINGELTLNGVVYNEMKGAFSSAESVLSREVFHSLFPDTCYGFESGGDPDYIPDLSYEKFLEFHSKYYHPSNSYIVLYGNGNWEELLKFIDDEYLSLFDFKEIDSKIAYQEPLVGMKTTHLQFPIGENETTDNKSLSSISYPLCEVDDMLTSLAIGVVSYLLFNSPGALVKQALIDEGFAKSVETESNFELMNPFYTILLKGADLSKENELKPFIDNKIKEILEKGLDKKQIESTINVMEFRYREADFQGFSKGLIYFMGVLSTWLYDKDPFLKLEQSSHYEKLKELAKGNYFEELIKKYFIDSKGYSIVSIEPSKSLGKEKEEKLKAKLSEYRNSLNTEELEKIVNETKELKSYQETPSTQEEVDTIPVLERNDLKCNVKDVKNEEIMQDDIKVLHHDYNTNGIGYLNILFNINNIDTNLLSYVSVLRLLLGKIDTLDHSYQEFDIEANLNTGGISVSIENYYDSFNDSNLYFILSGKLLYNKAQDACSLFSEIIAKTVFEDKKRINEILTRVKIGLENNMVYSGHVFSFRKALSYISQGSFISDKISGISFYQSLEGIIEECNNNFDSFKEKMKSIMKYIFRNDNVLISYNCEKEGLSYLLENVKIIKESLNNEKIESPSQTVDLDILNEGFKTSSNVQYVSKVGNFKKHGYEFLGSYLVLKNILNTEYLWVQGRVLGGAYGCQSIINKNGDVVFTSYRDPHLKNTINIYDNIVKFIEEFNADEKQMTKFIIGAVGELVMPMTPSQEGERALGWYLRKITKESQEKIINEVINCSTDDIKNTKEMLEKVLSDNAICVIGNESKIEEDKEVFKNIKSLIK